MKLAPLKFLILVHVYSSGSGYLDVETGVSVDPLSPFDLSPRVQLTRHLHIAIPRSPLLRLQQ